MSMAVAPYSRDTFYAKRHVSRSLHVLAASCTRGAMATESLDQSLSKSLLDK